jgi:NDP-sugar pyrophosphorylase family protein
MNQPQRKAIVLAGGKGTRLAPYTTILPKPLMPIDDIAIIEIVIRQLRRSHFSSITLAVGYLSELLMAYCGDGSKYDIKMNYSREKEPLGTAGPLALIPDLDSSFLVMNGDLLTDLDYDAAWQFHHDEHALATMVTHQREVKIVFGLIEVDERDCVVDYIEKPTMKYLISTGIYFFKPAVLDYLTPGQHCDLPTLIQRLIDNGKIVQTYLHQGYWLDIGRPDDYQEAVEQFSKHRERYLKE